MQWGNLIVLNNISMEMKTGERIAIVGPSGSGKSTILRLLAGLEIPTKGIIKLFGERQKYLRLDQISPPDVRLVFQNPALLGSLTVEENVGFLLKKNSSLEHSDIEILVEKSLREVGLSGIGKKLPGELSGGMQKRVSFARALISNPENLENTNPLLLYDEPTAGLDPIASTRIEDLIIKTTDFAGGASIVVSHVISTIERTSERVIVIYDGRIRWDGSVKEFKTTDDSYVKQFRTGNLQGPMQPKDI